MVHVSEVSIPLSVKTEYQLHKHIRQLFPECDNQMRPFLFRKRDNCQSAYVVSTCPPFDSPYIDRTKTLDPVFVRDGKYAFSLRGNPVKRAHSGGYFYSLYGEQSEYWLRRKMNDVAVVEKITGLNESNVSFRKEIHKITMHVVDFEGVIRCLDPIGLKELFVNGIGRGKSFGMGLLLMRRLS